MVMDRAVSRIISAVIDVTNKITTENQPMNRRTKTEPSHADNTHTHTHTPQNKTKFEEENTFSTASRLDTSN